MLIDLPVRVLSYTLQSVNNFREYAMADSYGAVVLSRSKDCDINAEKLCSALNDLRWSNDGALWEIHDDRIWFDVCQYPTARPEVTSEYTWVNEEGTDLSVKPEDMTQELFEQWEECDGDTHEECISLEAVAKLLVPFIHSGSITIAACSHEKSRNVDYDALTIYSDGKVAYEYRSIYAEYYKSEPAFGSEEFQLPEQDLIIAKLKQ